MGDRFFGRSVFIRLIAQHDRGLILAGGVQRLAAFRVLGRLGEGAEGFGYGADRIRQLASSFQVSSLSGPLSSLLSALTGGASLLILIAAVVIFMAFDQAGMPDRIAVIRDSRPHIADGLLNFAGRVRKY